MAVTAMAAMVLFLARRYGIRAEAVRVFVEWFEELGIRCLSYPKLIWTFFDPRAIEAGLVAALMPWKLPRRSPERLRCLIAVFAVTCVATIYDQIFLIRLELQMILLNFGMITGLAICFAAVVWPMVAFLQSQQREA